MAKVNPETFGTVRPKLVYDDLEADVAVLTISGFDQFTVRDNEVDSGERQAAVLTFEETGDKSLWLNKGMIETLVNKLGDDTDDWMGRECPVERYEAEFKGKTFPKVRVLPGEEWDQYLTPKARPRVGRDRKGAAK